MSMKTLGEAIARAVATQTQKNINFTPTISISLSDDAPNNTDGVNRFVMPEGFAIERDGANVLRSVRRYRIGYDGIPVDAAEVDDLQIEIETLAKRWMSRGGPLAPSGWTCFAAASLSGADCGYDPAQLSDGRFVGGLSLEFWGIAE